MRKLLFFVVILFISNRIYSQKKENTLLWKITKPNSLNVSYLFGTFHQVNPDFFDSLKNAKKLLLESNLLFVEAYQEKENTNTENEITSIYGVWNKEKWDSISTPTQQRLYNKFVNSKWGDEEMYRLPPALLMLTLQDIYLQGVCDTSNRISVEKMDNRIISIAKKNKIKIEGLDENQFMDIQKSTKKDKFFSLKNTIKTNADYMNYILHGNTNTSSAKFLFNYKSLSLDYSFNKEEQNLKVLLTGRNDKWMKKLPQALDTKNCFIAVGIRHLFYKDGLIMQLKKQGYSVQPVQLEMDRSQQ
ncbi:MAG: hypothetical protein DI598_01160 [Pseudopedobacter saltans]|uniref:TraB/GumN family protein n=1 Tax=Pseudopedobacter saltans TaxID=151895 RepID=A0A2W5F8E5_9SPHI|nr:MAG: hypothetical protein DI598_01160 [Pseudopedobacter saltans]